MPMMKARHLTAALDAVNAARKAAARAWFQVDAWEDPFPSRKVTGCPTTVDTVEELEAWVNSCADDIAHYFAGDAKREAKIPASVAALRGWRAPL